MKTIFIEALATQGNFGSAGIYGYSTYLDGIEIDFKEFKYPTTCTQPELLIYALKAVLEELAYSREEYIVISYSTYLVNGYNLGFKKMKVNKELWESIFLLKNPRVELKWVSLSAKNAMML